LLGGDISWNSVRTLLWRWRASVQQDKPLKRYPLHLSYRENRSCAITADYAPAATYCCRWRQRPVQRGIGPACGWARPRKLRASSPTAVRCDVQVRVSREVASSPGRRAGTTAGTEEPERIVRNRNERWRVHAVTAPEF
jgi:hypothetical protein